MAGVKETPRQKMIGMMYLVLTALLALNVSKEILDAFIAIDKGLGKTNLTLDARSQASIDALAAAAQNDPTKATPFLQKSQEVAKLADDMDKHIELLKAHIMAASAYGDKLGKKFAEFMEGDKAISMEKKDKDGKVIIKKPDENQNNTALLVGHDPKKPQPGPMSANELKLKLEKLRDDLKATSVTRFDGTPFTLTDGLKLNLDEAFRLEKEMEGKKEVEWETKHFYHVPLAALITYLSKIQTDVKKAKGDVLAELQSGINAKDIKFTDVTVAVVPTTSYVMQGEEYLAEIYLAAFNKSDASSVYIGSEFSEMPSDSASKFNKESANQTLQSDPDGKTRFRRPTSGMSLGDHGFRGMIEYKKPDGSLELIPFNIPPFTVAKPACVVSPTKMNVFYRGLENPVAISVPGVDVNKIKPSISGGSTLTKGTTSGEWIVKPGSEKECSISVIANINGKDTKVGEVPFRIKQIPTPIPRINGKTPMDGSISKSLLKGAQGVEAYLENFDFEVKATVESFTIVVIKGGVINEQKGNGNKITEDQRKMLDQLRPGDRISVENIVCLMPDKTKRPLATVSLRITN